MKGRSAIWVLSHVRPSQYSGKSYSRWSVSNHSNSLGVWSMGTTRCQATGLRFAALFSEDFTWPRRPPFIRPVNFLS